MTTQREAEKLIELLGSNVPAPVLGQIDNVTGAALVEIARRLVALEGVYVEPKPKPREYWIDDNGIAHDNPYQQGPTLQSPSMVYVREVIEADDQ